MKDEILKRLQIGEPNADQLNKINSISNMEYEKSEVFVSQLIASDNLVHMDLAKWSKPMLEKIGNNYIGANFERDHAYSSNGIIGRVFDYLIIEYPPPLYPDFKNNLLKESFYNKDSDRFILDEEGYSALFLSCFTEAVNSSTSDLYYSRVKDVSTGGYISNRQYICPLCGVGFNDNRCPHFIPSSYGKMWQTDPEYKEKVAPYYLLEGDEHKSTEVSVVEMGNLPRAKILNQQEIGYYLLNM